jgi:hypothetical protein
MKNLEARGSRPVSDRTGRPALTVLGDNGPSDALGECVSAPTRELAQRVSGTVEVLLLWHPEDDRMDLSVRDLATDMSFHLEVAPGDAIDAFYHPYAYAARRENSYRVVRADTTIVDG